MKAIKSLVTIRHACPVDPAAPHVELVEGEVFEVTDALADLLVGNGKAELVESEAEDKSAEAPVEEKPPSKAASVLKGRLGK